MIQIRSAFFCICPPCLLQQSFQVFTIFALKDLFLWVSVCFYRPRACTDALWSCFPCSFQRTRLQVLIHLLITHSSKLYMGLGYYPRDIPPEFPPSRLQATKRSSSYQLTNSFNAFILETYIAPLQEILLRGAPSPVTAKEDM